MKNKQALITIGALVLAVLITTTMVLQMSKAYARLDAARTTLATLEENKDSFISANQRVTALERKQNITSVEGIAQAVEDILSPLGVKEKLSSLKPVPSRDPGEDRAEVVFEGIDLNEMVNILYTMKNAPMLIIVRKASIKTSFLNPGLVDLSVTLSLIKPETK